MKKAIAVTLAIVDAAATMVAGAVFFGLLPRAHADRIDDAFISTLAKFGVSSADFDNCHGQGNAALIKLGHSI